MTTKAAFGAAVAALGLEAASGLLWHDGLPAAAALTKASYARRPAVGFAPGRSTAIAVCPAAVSSGATRCQYQAAPPAPGTRTYLSSLMRCGPGGAAELIARRSSRVVRAPRRDGPLVTTGDAQTTPSRT